MLMIIISIVIVLLLGAGIYYYLNSCNFAKECSYECFSKLLTNQLKEKNLLIALDSVDMNKIPPTQKDKIIIFKQILNEFITTIKGGAAEIEYNKLYIKDKYKTDKTCNNYINNFGADIIKIIEIYVSLYK